MTTYSGLLSGCIQLLNISPKSPASSVRHVCDPRVNRCKRFNGIIRLDVRDSTPADWEPYLAPKAADARRAIRHYGAHQDGATACGVPPYAGFTHIASTMKTMAGLLRQGRFADEIMQLTKTEVGEKR